MIEPSKHLQDIFENSINLAKGLGHEYITIEHIVYSMISDQETYTLLESFGADAAFVKTNLDHYLKHSLNDIKTAEKNYKPKKTNSVERVLNRCFTQVLFSGRQRMEVADVIISAQRKEQFWFLLSTERRSHQRKVCEIFPRKCCATRVCGC